MKDLITVGLDGTPQALSAALWAAREAELRRARLRLLHAWTPLTPDAAHHLPDEVEQSYWPRRIVDEAQAAVLSAHPGLAVEPSPVRADPLAALADAAEHSDLLALGSRGLGAVARFALGATGWELLHRTHVPLVLVRAGGDATDLGGSRNVAVGVGLRGAGGGLLTFAFETAARRAVTLRVVHGRHLPAHAYNRGGGVEPAVAEQAVRDARDELSAALGPWREKFPDVRVDEQVVMESPGPALMDSLAHTELLIVGRRHRGHLLPPRIGHIVQTAVHHAPCPVAVVPYE